MFIGDPEYFCQHRILLLSVHKGNTLHSTNTKVITAQLDVGSKYHLFTNITMFTYIIPVKFNVKILNGIKSPALGIHLGFDKEI